MMKTYRLILSAVNPVLVFVLAACSATPEYVRPSSVIDTMESAEQVDAPTAEAEKISKNFYHAKGLWTQARPADAESKGNWWEIFNDKELDLLLKQCRDSNPNLAAAYQSVEMAMARSRTTLGQLAPQVGINGTYSRTGLSENERSYSPIDPTYNSWRVGFGLTWDLDFFGRVRALLASDTADAQATYAAYQNTLLSLQANVANAYFTIRQYNSEIKLLRDTVKIRAEQVDYVASRVRSGVANDVDLKRAQEQLYEAQSQYEAVKLQRALTVNLLATLVGRAPGQIEATDLDIADKVPEVPEVIPSELLQRRPDIAQAERQVFAANQRIGAARAAFFPTVALSASGDLASTDIDTLINSSSLAWGVSPKIYIPIFQGGQLIAQEELALAEHRQLVEQYRATVLNAIQSVEDALAQIKFMKEELRFRNLSVASAREVVDLTRNQYDSGLVDYFELTDAQRLCLDNERAQIQLKGDQFRACTSLIAALGGGWYQAPDFEASDKRSETEKVLALPSRIFDEVNPNSKEFNDLIRKQDSVEK